MMNRELQRVENKEVKQRLTEGGGFIARRASSSDSNHFSNVAETGASAALVSDSPRAMNSLRVLSLLQVHNTLTKLHKLAPSYRQLMPLRPFTAPAAAFVIHQKPILSNVAETGASAALVSDSPRAMNSLRVLSLLQVHNTLTKLHKLAPSYRQLMPLRPLWN